MPKVLSFERRDELLDLICGGCPITVAAGLVGVSWDGASSVWAQSGVMGLKMVAGARGGLPGTPPLRCPGADRAERARRPLTSEDRAVIAAGVRRRLTYELIGELIGRDKSVVCREVARNRGLDGSYHAPVAHRAAHERRKRTKEFRLIENPVLCRQVEGWMDEGWSPKLIASMLNKDQHVIMNRVSHETIYQALYVQTRGGLRADLHRQLSLKRRQRKPRGSGEGHGKAIYANAFTIAQRPAEVADRAVPGHWEGDLIMGTGNTSAVGTLVERTTRFTILLHLPGRHDAESVAEAMIREMGKLPEHLRRSITWDRGTELADYAEIQLALKAPVFFCDPHAPWQRGTNENTNRLLRFWLEKGTDLSGYTAEDLHQIAATLNKRPRPTLDLDTPGERMTKLLSNPAAA
jgi:IS30 family transposase